MWTVFVQTLKESIHRRIALALIVVALFLLIVQFGFTHFYHAPNGELMVRHVDARAGIAAKTFVTSVAMPSQLQLMANVWVLLTLLATTALLTSYMDKGWIELLLSKGTPRWQIFGGRYLGGVAVFLLTAILMNTPIAYFALRAGVSQKSYWIALLFGFLSFLGGYSLIALASTSQPNSGLLVLVIFLEFIVSSILSQRDAILKSISTRWIVATIAWAYRILPKHEELSQMAARYMMGNPVQSWFPLWSTALFCVVATAWAFWRFERRAF